MLQAVAVPIEKRKKLHRSGSRSACVLNPSPWQVREGREAEEKQQLTAPDHLREPAHGLNGSKAHLQVHKCHCARYNYSQVIITQ